MEFVNVTKRTPTTHRTPTAEVERAVLDAAERLVAGDGPQALSIRTLAKEAGVAPMSIYNRFGDKHGVLLALFIRGFRDLLRHIDPPELEGAITTPAQALDRLRTSCAGYRTFARSSPGTYSLMFEQGHADVEPDDDAMVEAAAAFFCLVRHIEAAQAVGAMVGGNPAELAQRAWACIHGAISLELREIRFIEDMDAHYAAVVETVLAGLSPAAGIAGIEGPVVRPRSSEPLAVPR
jgi:AcrR family transcriptional regulator